MEPSAAGSRHLLGKALCLTGHADEGMALLRQAAEALRAGGDRNAAARCLMEVATWSGVVGAPDPGTPFEEGMALLDIDHPTARRRPHAPGGGHAPSDRARGLGRSHRGRRRRAGSGPTARPPGPGETPTPGELRAGRRWATRTGSRTTSGRWPRASTAPTPATRRGRAYNYTLVLGVQAGPRPCSKGCRRNIDFARRRGLEYWELGGHMVSACGFDRDGRVGPRADGEPRRPRARADCRPHRVSCVLPAIEAILVARRGRRRRVGRASRVARRGGLQAFDRRAGRPVPACRGRARPPDGAPRPGPLAAGRCASTARGAAVGRRLRGQLRRRPAGGAPGRGGSRR